LLKEYYVLCASINQNSLYLHSKLVSGSVEILDVKGRLMYVNASFSETTVSVDSWSTGVYIIRFFNPEKNEFVLQKVVK
jgi:hypothetical protein